MPLGDKDPQENEKYSLLNVMAAKNRSQDWLSKACFCHDSTAQLLPVSFRSSIQGDSPSVA